MKDQLLLLLKKHLKNLDLGSRIDGEIQVGKINHVVKVPSDFCVKK